MKLKKRFCILSIACFLMIQFTIWSSPLGVPPIGVQAKGEMMNISPVVYDIDLFTAQNIQVSGMLRMYDKENDTAQIEIITFPEKGEIVFDGFSFTYTPFLNHIGEDQVTVVAVDQAGNRSNVSTLSIMIEKSADTFYYHDMRTNPSHYSAIKLHENGLIQGQQIGEIRLFHPKQNVTRAEFLIHLLSALQLQELVEPTVNTGLQNDGSISMWLKPYITLGKAHGIIKEDQFEPDQMITNAEAVVYVDRAANIKAVRGYDLGLSDTQKIPEWAVQSYLNLGAYRMLDLYDGEARAMEALTRDTAADLIWQLFKYGQTVGE